jgi:hypothetical protein
MLLRKDFITLHFGGAVITNLLFQTVAIYKKIKKKKKLGIKMPKHLRKTRLTNTVLITK